MKKLTIFSIIVLMALAGCYKDIEIYQDSNFPQHLAIYSYFNPDSTIHVYVSRTAYPGNLDTSVWVENAQIQVYQNDSFLTNRFDFKTVYLKYGFQSFAKVYVAEQKPVAGSEYFLRVSDGTDTVTAKCRVPYPVPITSVGFLDYNLSLDTAYSEGYLQYYTLDGNFIVNFTDPPGDNYYILAVYQRVPTLTTYDSLNMPHVLQWMNASVTTESTNNEGLYMRLPSDFIFGFGYMFSDMRFRNQTMRYVLNLSQAWVIGYRGNVKLYFALFSIDKTMYDFYVFYHQYQRSQMSPFSEPQNIYTNVSNGYGLVAGLSIARDSLVISATGK